MIKHILTFLLGLAVWGVCTNNINTILLQAEGKQNLGIALLFAAIFTLVFMQGNKMKRKQPFLGWGMMGIVFLFECGIGFMLIGNVSYKQLDVQLSIFSADSAQISGFYTAKIDSLGNKVKADKFDLSTKLKELSKEQRTEKAKIQSALKLASIDSANNASKIIAAMNQDLLEKKEAIEKGNAQGLANEMQVKKVSNTILAFLNLILYFFIILISMKKEDEPGPDNDLFKVFRSIFFSKNDLITKLEAIERENQGLRAQAAKVPILEENAKIQGKNLEKSTKQVEASTRQVESLGFSLEKSEQEREKYRVAYENLKNSLDTYLEAPFTICANGKIALKIDKEGKIFHEYLAKKGWENKYSQTLQMRLGYEPKIKEKEETSTEETMEVEQQTFFTIKKGSNENINAITA